MAFPANYEFGAVPQGLIEFVTDKGKSAKAYFRYFLARTTMMFQYTGLPDTIPSDVLERLLQVNGICCITKGPDDKLYAFGGSLGGVQDVYYRPTRFIIANPHIGGDTWTKESVVLGDDEHDGVLMRNDTDWIGLSPLIGRYACLMAENVLTVRQADIMLRIVALLSADNDRVRKSAEDYLSKLEKGRLGVIADSNFSEGIKMQSPPSNNGSYLTQFIELQQYYKGSIFGELGLRANYNMKREAIGKGESAMDEDAILPLCDNMLLCRQRDMEEVNRLFDLDIKVEYSSAWLENRLEQTITLVSQLTQAGAANVGSTGGFDSSVSPEAGMGQVESSGEKIDGGEENAPEGIRGTVEANDGSAGDDVHSEHGDNTSNDEQSDAKTEEKTEAEVVLDAGKSVVQPNPEQESVKNINDIHGNDVIDALQDVVDDAIGQIEVGTNPDPSQLVEEKGDEENGSVGEADTSEDKTTDTSD